MPSTLPVSKYIGDLNEYGIAKYLHPSHENIESYTKILEKLEDSTLDIGEIDSLNFIGAEMLRSNIPDGWEIQSVTPYSKKFASLFSKKSATDLVMILVDTKSGKIKHRGISCKSYKDPRYLTLRNLGTKKLSSTLQEIMGDSVHLSSIAMKDIGNRLLNSKHLHKFWNFCHNFESDTWNLIINRDTGHIDLYDGKVYFAPSSGHGIEVIITDSTVTLISPFYDRRLVISLKTEPKRNNKQTIVVKSVKN